jgi:hypothetical protein
VRCIDDVLDAGTYSGRNSVPMLFDPNIGCVQRIGTDKEQALDAAECGSQGFGPIEIGLSLFHTQSTEFRMLSRSTRGRKDVHRSKSQEFRHDGPSEISTGSRHEKLLVYKTHVLRLR